MCVCVCFVSLFMFSVKKNGTENGLEKDGGTEKIIRKCPKATPAMTMHWDMKCF